MNPLQGFRASRTSFLTAFDIMGHIHRLRDDTSIKVAKECHCEIRMKQLLTEFMMTRSDQTLLDPGPRIFLLVSEVLY